MAKKKTTPPASTIGNAPRALASDGARMLATPPTHDEIAEAAYRRYVDRGGEHGRDLEDWVEAERELRRGQ
jgi:hypothetical protein